MPIADALDRIYTMLPCRHIDSKIRLLGFDCFKSNSTASFWGFNSIGQNPTLAGVIRSRHRRGRAGSAAP
jgi:hypothetical protein